MDCSTRSDVIFSEEILRLIKEGDSDEKVKEILQESCLHLSTDASGATLLHYCSEYNNANLIQYLVDRGCNVNVEDAIGVTPLIIAIRENHEEALKTLLEANADIFKFYDDKKSVLHMLGTYIVIKSKIAQLILEDLQKRCSSREEIVNKLVEVGCHTYHAIVLKDSWIIERILERNIPVDSAEPLNKVMAIHGAVIYEDEKILDVLLKYGANVNGLDAMHETPLFKLYKIHPDHNVQKIEILKTLVSRGATLTTCTSEGFFHTFYILTRGNRESIRILLESGLDFNVKDNRNDQNILHYLARNSDSEVVEELKLYVDKFDINHRDKHGQTPLLIASYFGNISMMTFFLEQNARTDLGDTVHGTTPLYYTVKRPKPCLEKEYQQCCELLLLHNANCQFVIEKSDELVTIFDVALEENDLNRTKPIIAHLALLQKRGTPITEMIWMKITSHEPLEKYFVECRELLAKQISERVKLFDLISSDKKKMARYLANENIAKQLQEENLELEKEHYYYSVLNRLYLQGNHYRKLKESASKMICKIFEYRVDETHIVVDTVINFLNDESLRGLKLIYSELFYRDKTLNLNDEQL